MFPRVTVTIFSVSGVTVTCSVEVCDLSDEVRKEEKFCMMGRNILLLRLCCICPKKSVWQIAPLPVNYSSRQLTPLFSPPPSLLFSGDGYQLNAPNNCTNTEFVMQCRRAHGDGCVVSGELVCSFA